MRERVSDEIAIQRRQKSTTLRVIANLQKYYRILEHAVRIAIGILEPTKRYMQTELE